MTLTRVATAMAAVLPIVAAAAWLRGPRPLDRRGWVRAMWHGLLLTLIGALWFGSLGHGQWWVVFGLLGALAANAERNPAVALLRSRSAAGAAGLRVAEFLAAGAVLAWLLG